MSAAHCGRGYCYKLGSSLFFLGAALALLRQKWL